MRNPMDLPQAGAKEALFIYWPARIGLQHLVKGYWFLRDPCGLYQGQPIATGPFPGAVLSINIGRPNGIEGGPLVPSVALLGLQSASRRWRCWAGTNFVMAMLTLEGVVRLFPFVGVATADGLTDAGAVIGDAETQALHRHISAAPDDTAIAHALDDWFQRRLEALKPASGLPWGVAALHSLQHGASVNGAAVRADVSRRSLTAWCETHLGFGPKRLAMLDRLHASLSSVQRGDGDGLDGYSDQAHQIRLWRSAYGVTPDRYRRQGASPARRLTQGHARWPAFFL